MQAVENILKAVGLEGPYLQEDYIEKVSNLGRDGENFLDAVDIASEKGFTPARWKKSISLRIRTKSYPD